jgi:hypothetical protein
MNRFVACFGAAALCLKLCACGMFHEHQFYNHTVLEEPCAGMTGKMEQVCIDCDETQIVDYPAESFVAGESFLPTIRMFHDRLNAIGTRLCPGMTVHLRSDDWSAVTELRHHGELFCEITYYDTDDYLDNPYPSQPMNGDMLNANGIRHINVLDFPDVPHPRNSFAAIAMTFAPMITEAEALELADFLEATRQEYYGNYRITQINGVGYGHAYPMNQLAYSGSISIHAGGELPRECIHDPDYTFSGDGIPAGYCTKCSKYISPAGDNWKYLTSMAVAQHSNSGADISIGNWEDPVGAVYWEAMKFWVADIPGYNCTEYIEYALDDTYGTLSGTIVSSADSDPDARTRVEIYLDGELVFVSDDVGYYDYVPYMIDIRGGKNIRILCTANTAAQAYCVVTAAVF